MFCSKQTSVKLEIVAKLLYKERVVICEMGVGVCEVGWGLGPRNKGNGSFIYY